MIFKLTNKQKLLNNIKQRRIAIQYSYLKEWAAGNITGIEAIELIVAEEQVVRMEEDLKKIEDEKKKANRPPQLPPPEKK